MITPVQLDDIAEVVRSLGCDEAATALRARMPGQRFVACSDDDIPPRLKPVREGDGFAVYCIAGSEHCLSLTADPESAIGVVLARVESD